jgi:LysM repeat protein
MSRNMTPIIYGILAVLAIALGLFVANIFGNPAPKPTAPNSVASAPARTAAPTKAAQPTSAATQTPKPTSAATQAPKPTSKPTSAATAAPAATEQPTPAAATVAPAATEQPTAAAEQPTAAAEQPTAAAEQPTAAAYIEYTVQRGDSLKVIAQRYNVTLQQILAINDIPNPDSLTIGTVIKIPSS